MLNPVWEEAAETSISVLDFCSNLYIHIASVTSDLGTQPRSEGSSR